MESADGTQPYCQEPTSSTNQVHIVSPTTSKKQKRLGPAPIASIEEPTSDENKLVRIIEKYLCLYLNRCHQLETIDITLVVLNNYYSQREKHTRNYLASTFMISFETNYQSRFSKVYHESCKGFNPCL